LSVKGARN